MLKERACLLEHLKRQVLKIAAALLTHQNQMPHHGMCLAERQATLGQVIGNIGSGKVPHAALARHGILVDGPSRNHSGHNGQALHERMSGIERALLVLLQVLVISKRQALHGHEQLHQVAIDTAALAANKLGKVGILLLRHDGRAGGVGV